MGYLSPVVIRFKILFQQLCEQEHHWNQPLSEDLRHKWGMLISELQCSPAVSIPRCFWNDVLTEEYSCALHGFCDASRNAYAAVVYLVIQTTNGLAVKFVASKTRVAPLKSQTIPRLELLSALLLARLVSSVTASLESEVSLTQPTCYSDSKVALYWIQGVNRVWKQFVQRSVSEIRELLPSDCWQYCPGTDNPADLPSRGLTLLELTCNDLWAHSPKWLGNLTTNSPVQDMPMPVECATELRLVEQPATLNLLTATANLPDLDCTQCSSMHRLLRITGCVLRFVDNLKNQINRSRRTTRESDTTSMVKRLARAEVLWIKVAQIHLAQDGSLERLKKQFDLFQDEGGVWRCGGRLSNADVPFHVKHPILLPRDHHVSVLIARRAHERVLHNGVKDTLTEVRSRFWIVKGRAFVEMIVRQGITCKRYEGKAYLDPSPPPLPEFRIKEESPFTYTGVDFAGPLSVKAGNTTSSGKVWICLYTCCVIRAVHLDIGPDLTAQAFIRCLKRFTARRGLPKRIISDNGKTCKAAAQVVDALVQHSEVQQYLSGVRVEWHFNLERAPWWGGVFKHMVEMMKRCLKKIIGRAKMTNDKLVTAVIEVESAINSRPLSYMSSDDLEQLLTPAHLLTGQRLLNLPDSIYLKDIEDDLEISTKHLTRRLIYLNRVLDNFWKRWRNEYVLELRDTHCYGGKSSDTTPVKVGDIVLVYDEKLRGFWKLARVEDLIIGRDGRTRGAVLRVATSGNRESVLQRPLQHLYPLKLHSSTTGGEKGSNNTSEPQGVIQSPTCQASDRPKRAAAIRARDRTKAIAIHENDEHSN